MTAKTSELDTQLPSRNMSIQGIREQLDPVELPIRSENMQNIYHALGAVGKHFDIPDEQWQKSVTDPLRAHGMPVNWKRAKHYRTKALTPMGNLTNLKLCRPDLYEEILANKVTCIDVKLLGGPEDNTDIEGRPARPRFVSQVATHEYEQWARDAVTATAHMTEAERFLGLLYAGSLRHLKIYYTYRNKFQEKEYKEHTHFCNYF